MSRYILGLSAYYHDSAACLLKDGQVIAAAQEERFSRHKNDARFPAGAIAFCVAEAGIEPEAISAVVFYEKPFIKFERLLETYLAYAPHGFKSFRLALPAWIKDKLFQKSGLIKALSETLGDQVNWRDRLLFGEHHLSHAASSFYTSPYESAAILTIDGVGEWATTTIAHGQQQNIDVLEELHFPHSLGLLYSAFTYYLGFRVNSGEYKVMGLAPYGQPLYQDLITEHLIDRREDGSFRLNMDYFDYPAGLTMTHPRFESLFDMPRREPESPLEQFHMDIAASIQKVTEQVVLKLARRAAAITGERRVCLAGGVALNCVANGELARAGVFDEVWVYPASGDAGACVGAALSVWHQHFNQPRQIDTTASAATLYQLGPDYADSTIEALLQQRGVSYQSLTREQLLSLTAKALADGKAIGWMQGRMEFGPRALGCRSILADPRSASMQRDLNLKIKYREGFRPFAPSVLAERQTDWFVDQTPSPCMQFVTPLRPEKRYHAADEPNLAQGLKRIDVIRSEVPAITHVDYSARLQSVERAANPLYYDLIAEFEALTGVPMVVNTSFNVRGEPIVCTPEDALTCFFRTELDWLIIGSFAIEKQQQSSQLRNGGGHGPLAMD